MKKFQLLLSILAAISITACNSAQFDYKKFFQGHPSLTVGTCADFYLISGLSAFAVGTRCTPKSMPFKITTAIENLSLSPFNSLADTATEVKNGLQSGTILKTVKNAALKSRPAVIGFVVIPAILHQFVISDSK